VFIVPSPENRDRIISGLPIDRFAAGRLRAVADPADIDQRIRLAELLLASVARNEPPTTEAGYDVVTEALRWACAVTEPEMTAPHSTGVDPEDPLPPLHASALQVMGHRLAEGSHFAESLAAIAAARSVFTGLGDPMRAADCDHLVGRCYELWQEHRSARKYFARAHARYLAAEAQEHAAITDQAWARCWLPEDEDSAEEHLLRARSTFAILELHAMYGTVEFILSVLYDERGDHEGAKAAALRAQDAYLRDGREVEAAKCDVRLGDLHRSRIMPKPIWGLPNPMEMTVAAQDAYQRAEKSFRRLGFTENAERYRKSREDLLDVDSLLPDPPE
jgi:tetratricopeptide (TPR) repeat protein